jgi:hypothetical protein
MRAPLHLIVLFPLLGGCAGESPVPGADTRRPRADRQVWPDQGLEPDGSGRPADRGRDAPRADLGKPKPDQGKPDAPGPCVWGESFFNGHCYRATGVKYITYATGKTICSNQSPPMQMVAIGGSAENQFVYGMLPPLNQVAWIGLKRTGPGTKDFAWENGEAVTYWNWAAGEPNNETGNEDCGVIWGPHLSTVSFRGFWNDMPCDANVDTVICERVP